MAHGIEGSPGTGTDARTIKSFRALAPCQERMRILENAGEGFVFLRKVLILCGRVTTAKRKKLSFLLCVFDKAGAEHLFCEGHFLEFQTAPNETIAYRGPRKVRTDARTHK